MGEDKVIYDVLKMALMSGAICLFGLGNANAQELSRQQIINMNTMPMGEVNVAGESSRGAAIGGMMSPKQRYEASCAFCHDTGTAGSPKIGVKSVWAPRLAQGMDILIKHAIEGIGTMPPKGMCPNCSDEEIAAAVQYMIDQSQ
jgi:cytochrome c5